AVGDLEVVIAGFLAAFPARGQGKRAAIDHEERAPRLDVLPQGRLDGLIVRRPTSQPFQLRPRQHNPIVTRVTQPARAPAIDRLLGTDRLTPNHHHFFAWSSRPQQLGVVNGLPHQHTGRPTFNWKQASCEGPAFEFELLPNALAYQYEGLGLLPPMDGGG